ncbi:unannotated protein [freshwater metagenome]|uniref:Unannotated protein n=1 Tax=freshwater metagenome TaxID=449393 RepID=A0A6J7KQ23_9ZZZZ
MLTDPTSCVGADPVDESVPTLTRKSWLREGCDRLRGGAAPAEPGDQLTAATRLDWDDVYEQPPSFVAFTVNA